MVGQVDSGLVCTLLAVGAGTCPTPHQVTGDTLARGGRALSAEAQPGGGKEHMSARGIIQGSFPNAARSVPRNPNSSGARGLSCFVHRFAQQPQLPGTRNEYLLNE